MTIGTSKNVIKLQKRREDSLASALDRINNILDFCKMYKMKSNIEFMVLLMNDIKSKIKFTQIVDSNKMKSLRYLDTHENPIKFSTNISEMLFDVYDDLICYELSDFESNLKQYLKYSDDNKLSEYKKNIRSLMGLVSIDKNKKMKDDLFKIKQDLLSCLKYNDKIDKEEKLESISL